MRRAVLACGYRLFLFCCACLLLAVYAGSVVVFAVQCLL